MINVRIFKMKHLFSLKLALASAVHLEKQQHKRIKVFEKKQLIYASDNRTVTLFFGVVQREVATKNRDFARVWSNSASLLHSGF